MRRRGSVAASVTSRRNSSLILAVASRWRGLPASRDPLPDTVVVIFTCTWPRHMPQSDSVTVTLCSPTEDDWLPAALEARGYAHEVGEFSTVLEVSDGGRFALKIGDGRARCTPTDAAAEIEMDRDVLGSLYLGAHRASTLAAANRVAHQRFPAASSTRRGVCQ